MVEHVTSFDTQLVAPIQQLIGQLTKQPISFGEEQLRALIESANSHLFILRNEAIVVGMLTLGTYSSPTGRKVWVEDVVVDQNHRGCGYGRILIDYAINYCKTNLTPCTLMLTSNPSRIAANALYRSSGFEPKQTNVYRMMIE